MKKITAILIAFMICVNICIVCQASSLNSNYLIKKNGDISDTITLETKQEIEDIAQKWLIENYKEFYDIADMQTTLKRAFNNGVTTNYTVSITCKTRLKADNVEDLPFVKGLFDEKNSQPGLTTMQKERINDYVKTIDFSKEYETLSIDIVVAVNNTTDAETKLYAQDGMDTTLYPIEMLALNEEQMYKEGQSTARSLIIASAEGKDTRGYSNYNRLDARDYAFSWTGSSVVSCYDDGPTCPILQDRTLWNNSTYPYINNLKHNDCADFVSQCFCAGGIPVDPENWDRFNDSSNNWAWTFVLSLKLYMLGKHYWNSSTFAQAAAGGILYWSDDTHIALITANDTVTHRYTAHTSDRYNYVFTASTSYYYYIINQ